MKGKVLGFDGSSGAINGEDGSRYRFVAANWKDPRSPSPGDEVDFLADGDSATEIYRLKGSGFTASSTTPIIGNDRVAAAREYAAARPQMLLATVVVFASIFLSFIESPSSGTDCCVSLTGAHKVYSGIANAIDQQQNIANQVSESTAGLSRMFGGAGAAPTPVNAGSDSRPLVTALLWISYLLWLIPAGAALIIYREYRGRRTRGLETLVGLAAVASIALIPLTKSAFSSATNGLIGYALSNAAQAIGFGFGAFVIALCGIGLILTASGKVARTPGL